MANLIESLKLNQYWHKWRIANLAKVFLIVLPALTLAYLIVSNWVDVPVHDQWAIARLILKQSDNSLVLEDLTKPYFEHRMFFPRLIILPLAFLTNWDVRYEMVITFAIACLNGLLIYRLAKLTTNPKYLVWALFCANLLIFSPGQWENWLMGMFFKYLIPTTCISAAFLICLSDRQLSSKVLFSGLLATISSFSIANGLLSWLVIFPVLFENFKQLKSNIKLVYVWWIGFVITLICYFWDYRSPSEAYSPFHLFTYFLDIPFFFTTLIGAPLFAGFQHIAPGIVAFGGFMLTFLFAFTALLRFKNQKARVWLMLGGYSIFSALLITAGRIAVGIEQAFISRYIPFAVPMGISLIFLWTYSPKIKADFIQSELETRITDSEGWQAKGSIQFSESTLRYLFLIFLSLSLFSFYVMGNRMSELKSERLEAKACLTWMIEVRNEPCLTNKVVAKLAVLDQRAQKLSDLGFLHPPLRNNAVLTDSSIAGQDYGQIDKLVRDRNGSYLISGWAVLADRSADVIILSYTNSLGQAIAFKLIDQKFARPDVSKALKNSIYFNSGWSAQFESPSGIESNLQIQAWSYDAETGKSYRLPKL